LKQAAPPGHGSPRPSAARTGTNRGVLGSKRFQCRKNSFRAWIYANWRNKAPVNDALRVDDEQGPFTGSVILTIYSIKTRDCSFHLEVSEDRKTQLAISAEGQVAPNAVHRDAEEFGIQFLKLRQEFVIERRLISAD